MNRPVPGEAQAQASPRHHDRSHRSAVASGRVSRRRTDSLPDAHTLLESPSKEKKTKGGDTSRRSVSGKDLRPKSGDTCRRSASGGDLKNMHRLHRNLDDRKERSVPQLFEVALKRQWAHVVLRCTTHPEEASFVRKSDGLTALHLAMISRTSFSNCETVTSDFDRLAVRTLWFACDDNPAPLYAVQALTKAFPGAVHRQCKKMGYTPLAYACLVPPRPTPSSTRASGEDGRWGLESFSSKFDPNDPNSWHSKIFDHIILGDDHGPPDDMFEEADDVVRTLLEGNANTLCILSHTDLSPVDIHVISFSQMRGADDLVVKSGKTTTSVLRVLLECDPSSARSRFSSSLSSHEAYTAGPLEYLYRWNATKILEAVENQSIAKAPWLRHDASRRASMPPVAGAFFPRSKTASTRGFAESTKLSLPSDIRSWWIWQWTMIMLKYSMMHIKRPGAPFSALHAAAYTEGCPLALLLLIVRIFPIQIKKHDEMVKGSSMLPLHIVCTWGRDRVPDAITAARKSTAIGALLSEYQDGAKSVDAQGRCPLFFAIESRTDFHGGIRKLVKAHPGALRTVDPQTGLYPFLYAAILNTEDSLPQLSTCYQLLRAEPAVLDDCFQFTISEADSEETDSFSLSTWDPFNMKHQAL